MRKPVILDVNPDVEARDWEADLLERLEAHVLTCSGPLKPGTCPLLRGEACTKVDSADGVLFQLDLDRDEHREILSLYADRLDVPIRAVVKPGQKERYAELLARVEVAEGEPGPAMLDGFEAEVESQLE
jgi:hypothetical protein